MPWSSERWISKAGQRWVWTPFSPCMAQCEDVKTSRLSIGCKVVLIMRFHHHFYRADRNSGRVKCCLCLSRAGAGTGNRIGKHRGKEPRSGLNVDSEHVTLPESYFLISKVRNFWYCKTCTSGTPGLHQPQSQSNMMSAIWGNYFPCQWLFWEGAYNTFLAN